MHVPGHQMGTTKEARGNALADLAAKEAAVEEKKAEIMELNVLSDNTTSTLSTSTLPTPIFNDQGKQKLALIGGKEDSQGKWHLPDGCQILNKE